MKEPARKYLKKANALTKKLKEGLPNFPVNGFEGLALVATLGHFMGLPEKHIGLVDRRVLKGGTTPHEEKIFSIFETYTEWAKKGKFHPNVELGKKLCTTTGQYGLPVDYQTMHGQQDRDVVVELADRLLAKYDIGPWSFDKGFWGKENKGLLQLGAPKVIMPKLGKRNKIEGAEENSHSFKRLKDRHSAIGPNINELENRGPNRCPDRGIENYRGYIGLGVCAYSLKKIGRKILEQKRLANNKEISANKLVA